MVPRNLSIPSEDQRMRVSILQTVHYHLILLYVRFRDLQRVVDEVEL
jgi:hypothetical protein